MRTAAFFAGAVVLGVFCVQNARGGNYAAPGAKYYNLTLTLGDWFKSTSGDIVLVDDVTDSLNYRPCEPQIVCDFFTAEDIPGDPANGTHGIFLHPVGALPPGFPSNLPQSVVAVTDYVEGVRSKALSTEVQLQDWDGSDTQPPLNPATIDAFSLSTYGELAPRSFVVRNDGIGLPPPPGSPQEMIFANSFEARLLEGLAVAHSMPMAIASVPTSQSRHFQSTYRLVNGRVYFQVTAGATRAISGIAVVKGRTLPAADPQAPQVDVTIVRDAPCPPIRARSGAGPVVGSAPHPWRHGSRRTGASPSSSSS